MFINNLILITLLVVVHVSMEEKAIIILIIHKQVHIYSIILVFNLEFFHFPRYLYSFKQ